MTEPRVAPRGALLLACALATAPAWAQTAVPSASAASAAERAQKETDRTMYWIRVLASKPAPVKPAAARAPVATTAAAPRPAPVAAASPAKAATEPREKVKAAPPPTTVAAAPEAAPPVVGRASPAGQASPAREVSEPVATSVNGIDNGAAASPAAASLPEVAPPPAEEPDEGLVQVKSVQPEFPTAIVRRVHKGNVEVHFEVEPGGKVVEATVVQSSHSRLNDAALDAVKQWRFKPGTRYHTAAVNLKFDIDAE